MPVNVPVFHCVGTGFVLVGVNGSWKVDSFYEPCDIFRVQVHDGVRCKHVVQPVYVFCTFDGADAFGAGA